MRSGSEIGRERVALFERGEIAEELQFARVERRHEAFEEQASEQAREHADGQEESGRHRTQCPPIGGDAAARHDAMDMRMVIEVLAPGVQHGREADLGAQVLGVAGDRRERLGGGLETAGHRPWPCSG